jgi:hypothetical protein
MSEDGTEKADSAKESGKKQHQKSAEKSQGMKPRKLCEELVEFKGQGNKNN